ncbi:hypothetical protein GCM10020220_029860 [Nonomuraea rubra]
MRARQVQDTPALVASVKTATGRQPAVSAARNELMIARAEVDHGLAQPRARRDQVAGQRAADRMAAPCRTGSGVIRCQLLLAIPTAADVPRPCPGPGDPAGGKGCGSGCPVRPRVGTSVQVLVDASAEAV